jgi:hypothetical protein
VRYVKKGEIIQSERMERRGSKFLVGADVMDALRYVGTESWGPGSALTAGRIRVC